MAYEVFVLNTTNFCYIFRERGLEELDESPFKFITTYLGSLTAKLPKYNPLRISNPVERMQIMQISTRIKRHKNYFVLLQVMPKPDPFELALSGPKGQLTECNRRELRKMHATSDVASFAPITLNQLAFGSAQCQSTIYKICISVKQAMLWKFSRPFPRGRL